MGEVVRLVSKAERSKLATLDEIRALVGRLENNEFGENPNMICLIDGDEGISWLVAGNLNSYECVAIGQHFVHLMLHGVGAEEEEAS